MSNYEIAIQDSINYLVSEDTRRSIEANPYWPKWNSPWWHMAVLHEMGLADRIPRTNPNFFEAQLTAS